MWKVKRLVTSFGLDISSAMRGPRSVRTGVGAGGKEAKTKKKVVRKDGARKDELRRRAARDAKVREALGHWRPPIAAEAAVRRRREEQKAEKEQAIAAEVAKAREKEERVKLEFKRVEEARRKFVESQQQAESDESELGSLLEKAEVDGEDTVECPRCSAGVLVGDLACSSCGLNAACAESGGGGEEQRAEHLEEAHAEGGMAALRLPAGVA